MVDKDSGYESGDSTHPNPPFVRPLGRSESGAEQRLWLRAQNARRQQSRMLALNSWMRSPFQRFRLEQTTLQPSTSSESRDTNFRPQVYGLSPDSYDVPKSTHHEEVTANGQRRGRSTTKKRAVATMSASELAIALSQPQQGSKRITAPPSPHKKHKKPCDTTDGKPHIACLLWRKVQKLVKSTTAAVRNDKPARKPLRGILQNGPRKIPRTASFCQIEYEYINQGGPRYLSDFIPYLHSTKPTIEDDRKVAAALEASSRGYDLPEHDNRPDPQSVVPKLPRKEERKLLAAAYGAAAPNIPPEVLEEYKLNQYNMKWKTSDYFSG